MHDSGEFQLSAKVDLRFAKAYLPICALFSELLIISVLVLFSHLVAIEAWTLAAIVVWFLKRVIVEEVLQYNSLLETVTLASILTHYRVLRDGKESLMVERVVSVLWVLCFCSINMVLSFSRMQGRKPHHHHKIAMWVCTLVLMLYSVYTPMNDDIVAFDVIKAFLFLVLCICWVYLYEHKALRYDHLHDCEECKLRFIPLLFTPVTLALGMVVLFCFGVAYTIIMQQRGASGLDSKAADKDTGLPSASLEMSSMVGDDDQEIFRLALQSRDSEFKGA